MSGSKSNELLSILDRPREPIYLPKGDDALVFDVPENYLDERFQETGIVNRVGGQGNKVSVTPITVPDLGIARQLGKQEGFSLFLPYHQKMAAHVIKIFMEVKNVEELESCALYCRQNLNPMLFNYSYSVALLHRPDTQNVSLPPLSDYFPDKFMDKATLTKARQEANLTTGIATVPVEIPMDYTASDMEPEHRVAYFREDLGINLHHWHWHLVYPADAPRNIVAKDRRGELFFYMHQQIVARYNFERLCNNLARVVRLTELREPLVEGYFPKLDSMNSSRVWPARPPNTILRNINREADRISFDILDMERWRDRLLEAVSTSRIIDPNGQIIRIDNLEGIDILGNLVEASVLSRNQNLYGNLHNYAHLLVGYAHDPEFRHLEWFGVIGDSSTAMRDPAFYRIHAFVDDIFQKHKNTFIPYTEQELTYSGIQVTGIEVISQNSQVNEFTTFWQQSDVNLARGMDFAPRRDVLARFTHLQHNPFEYKIQVNNSGPERKGTVRIFLAPKTDERGLPYLYNDHRKLMIELDKFVHTFQPNQNIITRRSSESSVVIPFETTFRNLDSVAQSGDVTAFNFCGCGWPEHMLIPKGKPEGMPAVLFVMVSDYELDKVDEPASKPNQSGAAISYCGLKDSKYPDRRPMGWPFDRLPRTKVDFLSQFLTPNMSTQDVIIRFTNRIDPPTKRSARSVGTTPTPKTTPAPTVTPASKAQPKKVENKQESKNKGYGQEQGKNRKKDEEEEEGEGDGEMEDDAEYDEE